MNWLKLAQALPTGHHDRIYHCGKDNSANIYHKPEGYSINCFRCGFNDFVSMGYQNYKELLEVKARNTEALQALQSTTLELPKNFSYDIPPEGMIWLLKASITPYMAKEAGFGWDTYFKRVILPVYNDNTLVYYQARAVLQGQTPKYLNPKVDRASIIYWVRHSTSTARIVVTEDILSAVRIGQHENAASILGTKITPEQAGQLANYNLVTTWLDADKAGVHGATKVRKAVGLATRTSNIVTPKDPKLLTEEQIKEQLWK